MRRTLEGLQNSGVQKTCGENLIDLEYADDIVLVFGDEEKAQVFFDELTKVIPPFGCGKRRHWLLHMSTYVMPSRTATANVNPVTFLKCEHVHLFRRKISDAFSVRWWSSVNTLASHVRCVEFELRHGQGYALLLSSNKSKSPVLPFLVWFHENDCARAARRWLKRESYEHYQKQLAASSAEKKSSRTLPSKEAILRKVKNVSSSAVTRILNEVVEDCSSVTLADVVDFEFAIGYVKAGNDRAKQLLTEAIILPTLRPELFTGLRAPVRGVLLFGPPGNGKTMLVRAKLRIFFLCDFSAKAVSSESSCIFFNISAASLLSKWVGESENTVRALFAVAREVSPSIIFLDEVDSLLATRRADSGHEVSRRVLTQLLAEMDGVQSGSERVLVLAATNRPQELDDAALRRFPRRVYVRMPDVRTRQEILLKLLEKNVNHSLSRTDVERIARGTEGFSTSDLKELAKEAALQPIREISTTQLRTISEHEVRPLALKDFIQSLKFVRPSVSGASLAPYESWNQQFGESNGPVGQYCLLTETTLVNSTFIVPANCCMEMIDIT
ncbi:spastin [Clonorchis sinensis]|uniref:microtubule-severing ATPase n=1 Tax=Clonorchis sinensis TaxID=79923 RepID=H2KNL1_CLOSI|nr:spastin [Clonorchis sinensis]